MEKYKLKKYQNKLNNNLDKTKKQLYTKKIIFYTNLLNTKKYGGNPKELNDDDDDDLPPYNPPILRRQLAQSGHLESDNDKILHFIKETRMEINNIVILMKNIINIIYNGSESVYNGIEINPIEIVKKQESLIYILLYIITNKLPIYANSESILLEIKTESIKILESYECNYFLQTYKQFLNIKDLQMPIIMRTGI